MLASKQLSYVSKFSKTCNYSGNNAGDFFIFPSENSK